MKTTQRLQRGIASLLLPLAAAIGTAFAPPAQSAIIGADGGITLYISYDSLDAAGGVSWNDMITQVDSIVTDPSRSRTVPLVAVDRTTPVPTVTITTADGKCKTYLVKFRHSEVVCTSSHPDNPTDFPSWFLTNPRDRL